MGCGPHDQRHSGPPHILQGKLIIRRSRSPAVNRGLQETFAAPGPLVGVAGDPAPRDWRLGGRGALKN